MRTAIYCRVSTEEQAKEGYSLASQSQRLRAHCEVREWTVADIYMDEGISAKDTNRPALQRMLADVRKGSVDVVSVTKLDRLSRSVLDLLTMLKSFEKHNVGFSSLAESYDTTTPTGKLMTTIIGAIAEFERETIAERVYFGMRQKAEEGKLVATRSPFGYRIEDGRLFVQPDEAALVRRVYEMYVGGLGAHRIIQELHHDESAKALMGGRVWGVHAVSYILQNPVYVGKLRWDHNGKRNIDAVLTDGNHEPILAVDVWEQAQGIREQRKLRPPRSGTGRYPLTGVTFCGQCGSPMSGHNILYGNGKENLYYRCPSSVHKVCDAKMIRADVLEQLLIEKLQDEITAVPIKPPTNQPTITSLVAVKDSQAKRKDIQAQLERLWDVYIAGRMPKTAFESRLAKLEQEEATLSAKVQRPTPIDVSVFEERERALMQKIVAHWQSSSAGERKELVRSIVERIEVKRGEIHIVFASL